METVRFFKKKWGTATDYHVDYQLVAISCQSDLFPWSDCLSAGHLDRLVIKYPSQILKNVQGKAREYGF
jgi:hypothetical protein